MNRLILGELLEVVPPASWALEKRAADWIVVHEGELEVLRTEPACVGRSLWIGLVPMSEGATQEEAIESVMRPRLGYGHAQVLTGGVAGREAAVLGWTDGVTDIVSFFARASTGDLIEFQAAVGEPPGSSLGTAIALADWLLAGVRWKPFH